MFKAFLFSGNETIEPSIQGFDDIGICLRTGVRLNICL